MEIKLLKYADNIGCNGHGTTQDPSWLWGPPFPGINPCHGTGGFWSQNPQEPQDLKGGFLSGRRPEAAAGRSSNFQILALGRCKQRSLPGKF